MIKLKRRYRVLTEKGIEVFKAGEKLNLPEKVEAELVQKGAAEETKKENDKVLKVEPTEGGSGGDNENDEEEEE